MITYISDSAITKKCYRVFLHVKELILIKCLIMKQEYYKLCDKRFDKAFKEVEGLARYPWVGCLYAERSNKCRPLIIGESHYATDGKEFSQEAYDQSKEKDFTRRVVNDVIKDKCICEPTWKMYEGLLKTFLKISPENVKDFWSKVAFYNFIQRVMKSTDEEPSDEDKRKGWKCLRGVIKVLEPTSIILIGVRNDGGSDSLNDDYVKLVDFKDDKENKVKGCAPRIGNIVTCNGVIPLTLIHHTSQRYSHDSWREYLKKRDPQIMAYLSNF